jgi:hypothetical protein
MDKQYIVDEESNSNGVSPLLNIHIGKGELSMNESTPKVETVDPFEEVEPNTQDYVPKPDEMDEVECEDLEVN